MRNKACAVCGGKDGVEDFGEQLFGKDVCMNCLWLYLLTFGHFMDIGLEEKDFDRYFGTYEDFSAFISFVPTLHNIQLHPADIYRRHEGYTLSNDIYSYAAVAR